MRHEVFLLILARILEGFERGLHSCVVALRLDLGELLLLLLADGGVDLQEILRRLLVFLLILVDADDDASAGLDIHLPGISAVLDFLLDVALLDGSDSAAHLVDLLDVLHRFLLDPVRHGLYIVGACQRIDDVGEAALIRNDVLRMKSDGDGLFRRKRERFVAGVRMEGLRAAHDGCRRLQRDADDVVVRLLRREHGACSLGMEAEFHGLVLLRAEAVAHDLRPDATGCTILRDFFEHVVVRVPEEGETAREIVDVESRLDGGIDVGDAVGDRKGNLLGSRGAGFADMVARDGNGVPLRHVLRAVSKDVGDEAHGRARREDVSTARGILLEDVVLDRARELIRRDALLLGNGDVHREQHGSGGIDCHRGRDLAEIDLVEERLHVGERVDRHADLADFTFGDRIVGVVADLRRQVEGARESRCTCLDQHAVALVGLFGCGEAGVHAHRPEAAAIHRRLHATRVGELARNAEIFGIISAFDVERRVETLLGNVRAKREFRGGLFQVSLVLFQLGLDFLIAHNRVLLSGMRERGASARPPRVFAAKVRAAFCRFFFPKSFPIRSEFFALTSWISFR